MDISASMVKDLREKTGAGMMDCKKALVETNGDMDKAIDYLREKGISKAAKKAERIAAEGLSNIYTNGNTSVVVELNSETDFVAKNSEFKELLDKITYITANKKECETIFETTDIDSCLAMYPNKLIVTLGPDGVAYHDGEKIVRIPAIEVEKVD